MADAAQEAAKNRQESTLEELAGDALNCIEKVAEGAEVALHGHRGGRPDCFASVNTFTGTAQVRNMNAISESERASLYELIRQPVIARVEYVDEDGKPGTLFITRTTPRPVPGYRIASYRSPLGSSAARAVGEDFSLRIDGAEHEAEIVNTAKLKPTKIDETWDSRDNDIDLGGRGQFTVVSLRQLLSPANATELEDAWDAWEQEDQEVNVLDGLRRAILSHIGLRDQPILDRHQDEIFRLPLNTRCFLSGPPGTGKTTTLIRRLGQKIDLDDMEALTPTERALIERASSESNTDHRTAWVMFSPTELLRQYVKEAFAREGFAASDHHIHTWDNYRDAIARDHLRLLRRSTGSGAFQKRSSDDHLDVQTITNSAPEWFEDFDSFFREDVLSDLIVDAEWLKNHEDPELAGLGTKLSRILEGSDASQFFETLPADMLGLLDEVKRHIKESQNESKGIITRTLNRLVNHDRGFPLALKQEIERQLRVSEVEDADDLDADVDDIEDDDENQDWAGRSVTREDVRRRYAQAVTTLASARARRRKVSEKAKSGPLLSWLGEDRVPGEEDLKTLGTISLAQARLKRFDEFDFRLFRSIAQRYKKFRSQRAKEKKWYLSVPSHSSDICWQELDLLVLVTLRAAGDVLQAYRKTPGIDLPDRGVLREVNSLYKNQVLIDEATDFSVLQLAAMYELSHPVIRSFFICGDINQRLTRWGIKDYDEINWVNSKIDQRRITVSYRQSGRLVDFAKAVAKLGGSENDDIVLPDRLDIEGVRPVWQTSLNSDDMRANWLADRIREIENMVGAVPTIAVLVNDDETVGTLADALNERLEDISLAAVACKDGKVVGNDRDVRVFNIEHIKGLEFEAVFFVGLDKTMKNEPDLFAQYIYVGATRAATYLGITFDEGCPFELRDLSEHFEGTWS